MDGGCDSHSYTYTSSVQCPDGLLMGDGCKNSLTIAALVILVILPQLNARQLWMMFVIMV